MKKTIAPRRKTVRKKSEKASVSKAHDAALMHTWQQTAMLVCQLISHLQHALDTQDGSDESWNRIFGTKDSTVMNLQKLVAVLGEISDRLSLHALTQTGVETAPPAEMNIEDMLMLKRWLEQELQALPNADDSV